MTKKIIFTVAFLAVCLSVGPAQALSLKDAFSTDNKSPLKAVVEEGAGFSREATFENITADIITAVLSLMGVIFLALAIYAGYSWMMARGNEEQVEKAKNTLTNAVIGLAVVLAAYAISYFIVSQIGGQVFKETPAETSQGQSKQ